MVKVILFLLFLFSFFPISALHQESLVEPWGLDSDIAFAKPLPSTPQKKRTKVSTSLIRFYQNYISPIDGPRSSFVPTSSQYTLQAIEKYGFLKGWVVGCDRLLRENKAPWVYERTVIPEGDRKVDPVR